MPDDVTPEQVEAMIGGRCAKVAALGSEINLELKALVNNSLRIAFECPDSQLRSFAVDVSTRTLSAAAEFTDVMTRLAADIQRRAEADRADQGPGGQDLVLGRHPHHDRDGRDGRAETPMDGAQLPASSEPLPRADLLALMQFARRAVLTVNEALVSRLAQPAQAPAEEEAWRTDVVQVASRPLIAMCHALEPAHVAPTSAHMVFAVIREMVEQGLAYLRQFQPPPAATEPPGQAPGSAA